MSSARFVCPSVAIATESAGTALQARVRSGGAVPQEQENWDPAAVWKQLRYRSTEKWIDRDGARYREVPG